MKRVVALCVLLLCSCGFSVSYAAQTSVDGYWEGAGQVPGDEFQFTVTFSTKAQGINGAIDIPDSGLFAWPLANISTSGAKVYFEIPGGRGTFLLMERCGAT